MGKKIKGVHVWWTKPAMRNKVNYYMPDYQLITLMLSALYWKKNYGEIVLYTDKAMVEFLKKTGIYDLNLWDEIDTDVVENIPEVINPNIYWAGAKLFVEKQLEPPFVMLDTDAYFKDYYEFDFNMDMMYFHLEDMVYPHYPPPKLFIDKYPNLKMDIPRFATNVATLFINNKELLTEYTHHAIEFMMQPEHNIEKHYDPFSVRIIFVEQVLLPILLQNRIGKYKSKPIIKDIFLTMFKEEQRFYRNPFGESNLYDEILPKIEHIWGNKFLISNDANEYFDFMLEQTEKLNEFKEAFNCFLNAREIINEIDDIENYKKRFNL